MKVKITHSLVPAVIIGLFFAVHANTIAQDEVAPSRQLFSKSIFRKNEQSAVSASPQSNDGSTNIIFYKDRGNNDFRYLAETNDTLYRDTPSFADYPGPVADTTVGKYAAIEFSNDKDQFTCAGLSLDDCIADPHFISRSDFDIVADNALLPDAPPPAPNLSASAPASVEQALLVPFSDPPLSDASGTTPGMTGDASSTAGKGDATGTPAGDTAASSVTADPDSSGTTTATF